MANATGVVFDALGDGTRRAILDRLRAGPLPAGEVAAGLPVSRPAVSQHLRVLREAGL
jgi:DNA-binding transcriptional ArsR family regulator